MKVSGQIFDYKNEILPLANIKVITGEKANRLKAIADYKGNFVIDDPAITDDTKITISYLGYLPQTFSAKDLVDKKIVLQETAIELAEVVIEPPVRPKTTKTQETKEKFLAHLDKHKTTYASLGAITGLALIVSSLKTK